MNTFTLIALALIALFGRFLPKLIQFIKLVLWSRKLPGPTIGELIENAKKRQILFWFKELREKHGSPFRIWLGKDLVVFFTDPDDVKQLLSDNTLLHKSNNYKLFSPWLGNGLLTNSGESWHSRRKLLTPAFHFRILSEFKEPMEENCKLLVDHLQKKANEEEFDVFPYITLLTLDVICETAMGIKKNAQMQSESEYVKAVKNILRVLSQRSFSIWHRNNIFFNYTSLGREMLANLKILHGETNRVIKLRRKLLQDSKIHSLKDAEASYDSIGQKRRFAFLDMLLISQMEGIPLSDRDIREEVDTFMFEGHDTTSSAIGFAIYLFSQHAEVQQLAYEEAIALEGREKEPMPYLEAVIKETLRIYPSVPFYSRLLTEDMKMDKLTVPKGASVTVLSYMVHRNENCYPEPEVFKPERFLQNNKEVHPFSFVAFSAGPRNCIGQKFAMLELKCTLSCLLRNFEFLPVQGFKPHPFADFVMKSSNGIKIRIKPRKN
ncbi:probable cytochrome P450 4s3 [Stomoxys calcitrans]|uniref:probable cytochrome P450 4s3 n=1 Tax=Stomoxys calcitrans TaxID=35570 RepID=UPI0027E298EA|nr:probable cytochrome P450 4s3 [Stomoxys calcitrans]